MPRLLLLLPLLAPGPAGLEETLGPSLPVAGWEVALRFGLRPPAAGEWRLGLEVAGGTARLGDPAGSLALTAGDLPWGSCGPWLVWRALPGSTLLLRNPGAEWSTAARSSAPASPGRGGGVEVEEILEPRPAPGVLFRRRFTARGLAPGESIWVRCGPADAPLPLFLENAGLAARRVLVAAGQEVLVCAVRPFASERPMVFALEVPEP